MKENAIITFVKKGKKFDILDINSNLAINDLSSMKDIVFEKNILNSFFKEDGTYK
jgi:hypothetical protein